MMRSVIEKKLRRTNLIALAFSIALAGCSGSEVAEEPVYYTNRAGVRVEALAMTAPRADHAAVRLRDGRVLICGGTATANVGGVLASAEIYDPAAHSFTVTGDMTTPRQGQTANLLNDGTVLLSGGVKNIGYRSELSSAELYDPETGSFRSTSSMSVPREGHTATLLRDGRVLVTGGSDNGAHTLDSAEIYDPKTGEFTRAGHMNVPRIAHTATVLRNGKVLIAGGGRGDMPGGYIAYNSAELYDPATQRFTSMHERMVNDRIGAAAVLLSDGRVLIVGGKSGKVLAGHYRGNLYWLTPLDTAEYYDPESESFRLTGRMAAPHYLGTLAELDDGSVLVVGGWKMQGPVIVGMSEAELFNPESNTFAQPSSMHQARLENTATLLPDGEVLIAGGIDAHSMISASVEFYQPAVHRFAERPETGAPSPSTQP